tara:strand:+ start:1214 stop:1891 length:678 start_codon:yes stop_codon:yes gene_type:complete
MSQTYCALSELKTWLGLSGSGQDDNLNASIKSASSSIAKYCGRQFDIDSTVQTRVYDCEFMDYAFVDDIATTTGLIVKTLNADASVHETLTINTDFLLAPYNADKLDPAIPFDKIVMNIENGGKVLPVEHRQGLQVTAKFGFPSVPDDVKQAALIQSARYFQRKNSPMGFSGNPETGQAPIMFLSQLDPDVKTMIRHYKKSTITLASGRPYVGLVAIENNRQYGV